MSVIGYKISLPPLSRPKESDTYPPASGYNVAVRVGRRDKLVLTKFPGRKGVVHVYIAPKSRPAAAAERVNEVLSAQISELTCVKVEHMAEYMAGKREDLPVCHKKK